jgi:rhomboid family protein
MRSIPPGTQALLIANCAIYVLQILGLEPVLVTWFALWPIGATDAGGAPFWPWQLISYSFLHASPTHLLLNMFALWMFGGQVEAVYGRSRFLTYYFVCVISAGLTQLLVTTVMGAVGPTVGASGGIFGLLLAYAILFPRSTVMLIFPPIPLPARVFVVLYAGLELFYGVSGTQGGVAHFAHLGGMLGGWLLIKYGRSRVG